MNADLSRVKDRIRKLLALAENDGAMGAEIDNAMRLATEMMLAYQISRDDLHMESENGGSAVNTSNVVFGQRNAYSYMERMTCWEGQLATFVCDFLGTVQCYKSTGVLKSNNGVVERDEKGRIKRAAVIVFYGPEADVEFAQQLYTEIQLSVIMLARLRWGSHRVGDGGSYCEGFVVGMRNANYRAVEQITAHSDSRALVLRSQQQAIALRQSGTDWLQTTQGVKLGKGQASRGVNRSFSQQAYSEGKSDGAKYQVSRERGTSQDRKRIS